MTENLMRPHKVCSCTGYLSNPGGKCCMDIYSPKEYFTTTTTHMPFQTWGENVKKREELPKVKKEQVENIFEFIAVDAKKRDDIRHIKNALHELHCWIKKEIQDNEYRAYGIKALEEAAMWLNKSISRSMKK